MRKISAPTPTVVSRRLRSAGITVLPSGTKVTTQGVRVTKTGIKGTSAVTVDTGLRRRDQMVAVQIEQILTDAGYRVERKVTDEPGLHMIHLSVTESLPIFSALMREVLG